MKLNHLAVHLKLTHCKSTIFKKKFFFKTKGLEKKKLKG